MFFQVSRASIPPLFSFFLDQSQIMWDFFQGLSSSEDHSPVEVPVHAVPVSLQILDSRAAGSYCFFNLFSP